MELMDSHAHLYSTPIKDKDFSIVERFIEQGVSKVFMPNVSSESIDAMLKIEDRFPGVCYSMMGLHPCSVGKDFEKELYIVEDWLGKRAFTAIGEMGLDLYWDKTFYEQQVEAFKIQAQWAIKYNLPLVIHSREATEEALDIIEGIANPKLKGVFHCWAGSTEQAERAIRAGFVIGVGGTVTYKNSNLPEVLKPLGFNNIVLETDTPYLPPVPYRGKPNEPAYIKQVAFKLAEIFETGVDEIAKKTSENCLNLFKNVTIVPKPLNFAE